MERLYLNHMCKNSENAWSRGVSRKNELFPSLLIQDPNILLESLFTQCTPKAYKFKAQKFTICFLDICIINVHIVLTELFFPHPKYKAKAATWFNVDSWWEQDLYIQHQLSSLNIYWNIYRRSYFLNFHLTYLAHILRYG